MELLAREGGVKSTLPVVVLMMENRSFDHMLGGLSLVMENGQKKYPGVNGLTGNESNPDTNNSPVKVNPGNKTILPNVGLNLGFTNSGILKLVPGADLKDPSYTAGAKAQAAPLNDPVDAQKNPSTLGSAILECEYRWSISDHRRYASRSGFKEAVTVLAVLGATVAVSFDETGNVRPGSEKGHEHFGWLDGVSQPGINGLSNPFPGQRLLDPGLFVFGYATTGNPPLVWMKNGSFMVFRRLKQLVPEFDIFTLESGPDVGDGSGATRSAVGWPLAELRANCVDARPGRQHDGARPAA